MKAYGLQSEQPLQIEKTPEETKDKAKKNMTVIQMLHRLFMKTAADAPWNWKANHLRLLT
jgi:hypothetical protein